jgi:excisionase family DNA binding protein
VLELCQPALSLLMWARRLAMKRGTVTAAVMVSLSAAEGGRKKIFSPPETAVPTRDSPVVRRRPTKTSLLASPTVDMVNSRSRCWRNGKTLPSQRECDMSDHRPGQTNNSSYRIAKPGGVQANRNPLDTIPFAQRLSCTVAEACVVTGLGRTKLYELIGAGSVGTTLIGRRRLVSVKSLLHLVSHEPTADLHGPHLRQTGT